MPKSKQRIKRRVKLANKARKHNSGAVPSFISVYKDFFTIERSPEAKPFAFGKLVRFKYKYESDPVSSAKNNVVLRVMQNNKTQSAKIIYNLPAFSLKRYNTL